MGFLSLFAFCLNHYQLFFLDRQNHCTQREKLFLQKGRKDDLRRPQAEDDAAHGQETGQRELQTDGEQQEHDPDLGHEVHGLVVGNPRHGMRPDQDADGEISEDGGQSHPTHQHHGEDGADEEDEHPVEWTMVQLAPTYVYAESVTEFPLYAQRVRYRAVYPGMNL